MRRGLVDRYDVVVVGAGPAGSLTARCAAAGGARTLLIEKRRQEIGSPVRCGEGIARHFLDECDIAYDKKWVAQEVSGAKVVSPNGASFKIDEKVRGTRSGSSSSGTGSTGRYSQEIVTMHFSLGEPTTGWAEPLPGNCVRNQHAP